MFFYFKFIIVFILITIGIKIGTKLFIYSDVDYNIADPEKSGKASLLIVAAEILITIIYLLIIKKIFMDASLIQGLILLTINYLIQICVVFAAVKIRNETILSIGISKNNLLKSIITGILISLVYYVLITSMFKVNKLMDINSLKSSILFINYFVVGFSEEIIFRGYLQVRLISWLGTIKGLFLTSIIFSFFHLPNRLIFGEASLITAIMNCILLLPISMLLGYIFIKTKNIIAGSIFHTFNDWIQNVVNIIG